MGQLEWAMWANENALVTCVVLILGGILAAAGQFDRWQIGIYAIFIGVVILLLEYPRGRRKTGTSVERKYQKPFTSLVRSGRLVTRNYLIRFVLYIGASVPCCFILQTLLGAFCLMFSSFIYLVAAIKGEEWLPIESAKKEQGPKIIEQPKRPPPRRPDLNASRQSVNTTIEELNAENRV